MASKDFFSSEKYPGASLEITHVVIREVDLDDWGYAGEQVSEFRKQGITADKK